MSTLHKVESTATDPPTNNQESCCNEEIFNDRCFYINNLNLWIKIWKGNNCEQDFDQNEVFLKYIYKDMCTEGQAKIFATEISK